MRIRMKIQLIRLDLHMQIIANLECPSNLWLCGRQKSQHQVLRGRNRPDSWWSCQHFYISVHHKPIDGALYTAVADPGFPVGGPWTLWGGRGLPRRVCFGKFCMLKRKNLDP